MMRRRTILLAAGAVATLASALFVFMKHREEPSKAPTEPRHAEDVAKARKRCMSQPLSLQATYGSGKFLDGFMEFKDPSKLPFQLRVAAGLAGGGYLERMKAVDTIGRTLPMETRAAIYAYIAWGTNDEDSYAVKNDLMNELRKQSAPPPEFTDVMLDLVFDKSQNMTVRIYALQHLCHWFEDYDNERDRRLIVSACMESLSESSNELCGVAILALTALAERKPEYFEQARVKAEAVKLASDEGTFLLSRISAIQACALMGASEALPTFRSLAANPGFSMLKVSAIAAIGALGDRSDLELLDSIAGSKDLLSAKAVRTAAAKINTRYMK